MSFTDATVVLIGGVDKTSLVDVSTLEYTHVLNGRSTARFKMHAAKGSFRPADGVTVAIQEAVDPGVGPINITTRLGGLLNIPREIDEGLLRWDCGATSYDQLCDRHYVTATYYRWPAGDIIKDIAANAALSGGTGRSTFHEEGATVVGVENGPRIIEISFDTVTVTQAFNDIADRTGYNWTFDMAGTKDLEFRSSTSVAGPGTLDNSNLRDDPKPVIKHDKSCYVNRVIAVGAPRANGSYMLYQVSDAAEIAARAAIEGTSGIYVKRFDRPSVNSAQELRDFADAMLARWGKAGISLEGATLDPGYAIGQMVTVNLPDQDASNVPMLIHKVRTAVLDHGKVYIHFISARGPTA